MVFPLSWEECTVKHDKDISISLPGKKTTGTVLLALAAVCLFVWNLRQLMVKAVEIGART